VAQAKAPEESVAQSVRPQMRPDHAEATVTARVWPGGSAKPVVDGGGAPALERIPGHTVYSQLLVMVNVAGAAPGDYSAHCALVNRKNTLALNPKSKQQQLQNMHHTLNTLLTSNFERRQ
jgi:hypothetical protein